MSEISCKGLHKSYGAVRAVGGADLEVEAGSIGALLGPSGCGKTTMLRLIGGFERPDAGTITVGGELMAGDGRFVPPEKRHIGMVFQDYALFPHLDVARNVGYALGRDGRERVREVLDLVGLTAESGRYPHELSGGQQQRVALARALAPTPRVVLLDEPFSNLDATLRAQVRQEIRGILVRAGVTAVFVTHDQEEALSIADTVAVMRAGRIEQHGTPEEMYQRPATRWVAEFVGEADIIAGTSHGGWVECALARLPISPGFHGPAQIVIRPESVAIGADTARSNGTARVVHAGVVTRREFYGHDQLLHVRLDSGLTLRSRRLGFPAWQPGDRVQVWLDGPVSVLPADDTAKPGHDADARDGGEAEAAPAAGGEDAPARPRSAA
jgi:iron(III) transport system ATP-binding protein